jgi:simple sugar transport system ATP-binding protein
MNNLLGMTSISKSFGEIKSLVDVDFHVGYGEIVGLLGDNGAGKSTLIKIMTGYLMPDNGGIFWKGNKIPKMSVDYGHHLGIEVVYQERALIDQQPIWKNIFVGRELTNKIGLLKSKEMKKETQELMERMGLTSKSVTPNNIVKTMSGGERQGIAISRALYFDAELIILDEPTMGLSLSETEKTLEFIGNAKKAGKSVVFIDHNIFHVYPIADRIVVLDRGRITGEFMKNEITLEGLIEQLKYVARTGVLQ